LFIRHYVFTRCELISLSVSFRQFLTSLLETMSRFKHLSRLYWDLKKLIHRYDDCLVTCGISFSKRNTDMDYQPIRMSTLRRLYSGKQLRMIILESVSHQVLALITVLAARSINVISYFFQFGNCWQEFPENDHR